MPPVQVSNAFEFVVVASLRVRQLVAGCTPRVPGHNKMTVLAREEVLAGKITKLDSLDPTKY